MLTRKAFGRLVIGVVIPEVMGPSAVDRAISEKSTFEEMDVDSLDMIEMLTVVGELAGVPTPDQTMFREIVTVGDFIDELLARSELSTFDVDKCLAELVALFEDAGYPAGEMAQSRQTSL